MSRLTGGVTALNCLYIFKWERCEPELENKLEKEAENAKVFLQC